jgi:hypothetical protein
MRHPAFAIACLALTVGLAACGGSTAPTPSQGAATTLASFQASSARPSASAQEGAAPPELAGTWRRSYEGDPLLLTFQGTGYSIQVPGELGAGRIFVDGDRITFSAAGPCPDGTGTYTWAIEDERLRFTLIGEDPCARKDFLLLATFGRADP